MNAAQSAAFDGMFRALDRVLGSLGTQGSIHADDWRIREAHAAYAQAQHVKAQPISDAAAIGECLITSPRFQAMTVAAAIAELRANLRGPIQAEPLPIDNLLAALVEAEDFMSGFEGDDMQPGIDGRLKRIRSTIAQAQASKIASAAPVMVDAGEPQQTTWGQFVADNADAIEGGDIDLAEVTSVLLARPGCTYHGGGGAAAQWSIRLLVDTPTAIALMAKVQS